MATSISAILIQCLKSFNQLQERVEQPDYSHEEEVSSVSWGDELGRLRIWAANIGAHQTGQSSLDFRLRDASHISNQITKLLRDLNRSLDDILEELSEDETEASEDDEAEASWLDDNSTTELQQLHEEVINIIDCLYQLSMLIRKPAQHDLLVGSRMDDKAEFAFYDKEHVRNLYPRTEEQISQRLGRAITRRRKYLNYRERHHRKLEKGIEEIQGTQRTTTGSVMSETTATDFKTHNIDFEETSSHSGMSQTSYAPSLIDGGRVTIPPPPRESVGGKPFECPYCFFVIDIKNTRSWTRHIFKDIKPYLCTFADCSMPDRLYDSRREWCFHETTEHHREDFVCALCKDALKSSKQYERHVARHLEELALFALPRTEMDDAEYDDDDVVGARAPPSGKGVTVDTAHSPDHSDHSSLASLTDDEDSTGTDVQVRPRFYSPDHSDRSSSAPVTDDEGNRSPDATNTRRGRDRDRERQTVFDLDRSNSAAPAQFAARYPSPINPRDRIRRSRSPSPDYDSELKRKITKLQKLDEREKELLAQKKPERERLLEEVTKSYEHAYGQANTVKGEEELREEAIEEYNREQKEGKEKEELAQEKFEEERLLKEAKIKGREELREEEFEKHNRKKKEEKEKKGKALKEAGEEFRERMKTLVETILLKGVNKGGMTRDLKRPTYVRVHRKHVSPVTLDEYNLPWEWDERDSNYIVIEQWIHESVQNALFEHTKALRERRKILEASSSGNRLKQPFEKYRIDRERTSGHMQRSRSEGRARERLQWKHRVNE